MKDIEMSTDGGETWEKVRLPNNCLPYHQVELLGEYTEGAVRYRSLQRKEVLAA